MMKIRKVNQNVFFRIKSPSNYLPIETYLFVKENFYFEFKLTNNCLDVHIYEVACSRKKNQKKFKLYREYYYRWCVYRTNRTIRSFEESATKRFGNYPKERNGIDIHRFLTHANEHMRDFAQKILEGDSAIALIESIESYFKPKENNLLIS